VAILVVENRLELRLFHTRRVVRDGLTRHLVLLDFR
jgi:hypothetical protein